MLEIKSQRPKRGYDDDDNDDDDDDAKDQYRVTAKAQQIVFSILSNHKISKREYMNLLTKK